MSTQRETVAAADLIPGDLVVRSGAEITGYPYAGVEGRTAVPLRHAKGIDMILHVDSEEPFEVLR